MTEDRCRGHCCKCFVLSVPYEELKQDPSKFNDGLQILGMLVPLGKMTQKQACAITGELTKNEESPEVAKERFTCRHLSESGDCVIYESRPWMCRVYPKNGACEYKECRASCSALKAIKDREHAVIAKEEAPTGYSQ